MSSRTHRAGVRVTTANAKKPNAMPHLPRVWGAGATRGMGSEGPSFTPTRSGGEESKRVRNSLTRGGRTARCSRDGRPADAAHLNEERATDMLVEHDPASAAHTRLGATGTPTIGDGIGASGGHAPPVR